ncbi:MAG TPA: hypothetical protein DCY13_21365 [Verrucomicrobiales bacterium]|nr:hypothetical protein [Verrucomicrobiales bacterium]
MKTSTRMIPLLVAAGAVLVGCSLPLLSLVAPNNLVQSLEWDTYDWRMRLAAQRQTSAATNVAAIYLDEESMEFMSNELRVNWPFPRQVHGRIVRELKRQGALVVAFDVLFSGLRPMDSPVERDDGSGDLEESDDFFARQMLEAGNVLIGAGLEAEPSPVFAESAAAVGSIVAIPDADGVLRRIRPVIMDEHQRPEWHLGVLLAAHQLGANLDEAELTADSIVIRDRAGDVHELPLDGEGHLLVDWNLHWNDPRIYKLSYAKVVSFDRAREIAGDEGYQMVLEEYHNNGWVHPQTTKPFEGKIVVVGSVAEGNNVTDRGATPLAQNTPLVSTHLNVANTILLGRHIRPVGLGVELLLVLLLAVLTCQVTWRTNILHGAVWVLVLGLAGTAAAVLLFVSHRIWSPLVSPLAGGLLVPYLSLVTYRVVFEEREQRRIKQVFKRIVSPNVVNELLAAESLSLGGARRNITVFFADVRGFTEMTDSTHAQAEEHVRKNGLAGPAAEQYYDDSAREVLATVNLYLATIADVIKEHDGTLDKYIGDCVMAFWGAPTPNEQHAVACVRAAIDAQRSIHALNVKRADENARRKAAAEENPVSLLPLLTLGTGINSGIATVGLMGSEEHISNYTVFGREINLASRLESFSGRGRIIIGENTFLDLQRFAPELASICVKQAPATFKGFREALTTYEVPWRVGAGEPGA